nr:hypothetical protein [uncultured Bacillus sp.]
MQQQNFNAQNQQQVVFQQPPAVISTKDALYLTDMLSWNLLAMKKAHYYAQQVQDQELINAFNACGQMHQHHYERILTHLDNQNQSSTGNIQQ